MSELSKLLLAQSDSEFGAMETCYKVYTWLHHTMLMLLLQIMWKLSQISDYFNKDKAKEESRPVTSFPGLAPLQPLTKEYKYRRHIRSMSDVQSSTPYYRLAATKNIRKGSHPTLSYDSDTRARRIRQYRLELESSDSSDCQKRPVIMDYNIMKHSDSMRIL